MIMTHWIKKADEFAEKAHKGQYRKYKSHEEYIMHPRAVADIVASVNGSEAMIVAALLHDVVEDTLYTIEDIGEQFGTEVAKIVGEVTDIKDPRKNRAERKKDSRERLGKASYEGKTVKLADVLHNTPSIISKDPDFAKVFVREKELLLPFLKGGNEVLFEKVTQMLIRYRRKNV